MTSPSGQRDSVKHGAWACGGDGWKVKGGSQHIHFIYLNVPFIFFIRKWWRHLNPFILSHTHCIMLPQQLIFHSRRKPEGVTVEVMIIIEYWLEWAYFCVNEELVVGVPVNLSDYDQTNFGWVYQWMIICSYPYNMEIICKINQPFLLPTKDTLFSNINPRTYK